MEIEDVLDKKIIIFGTGIDALRCLDILYKKYNIKPKCFMVNECQQQSFAGYKVQECDSHNINTTEDFILVATKETTYATIRKQLCDNGYIEFEHFIYYEWMFKEIVLLHGNCHFDVIEAYLRSSKKFMEKHSIYPNPRICMNVTKNISVNVLQNVDIWIHEDIQDNNGYSYYLSDSYLRNSIKKSVKEIIIPHLFGLGKILFPFSDINKKNASLSNGYDKNGMFPYADLLIDQYVNKGFSVDEIVPLCLSENSMTDIDVLGNFHYYLNKIRQREEGWSIKISDFILSNYKKKKLFYDIGHPTNVIFEYITYGVLDRLGINDTVSTEERLDYHEVPVYPSIKKALKLEWKEDKIRTSSEAKRIMSVMDTEEYIREYLYWCHQM